MGRRNFLIAGLGGGLIVLCGPILADTRAGVEAWTRGDFSAAVTAWQVEVAKGDADAMFNLGQAYKLGNGVKQDLAKAEALFGRAAALGHIQASDNYGLLLFQRGQRSQALPYIRAAANRGEPRAQYLLGIGHFNGDIVPRDWVRAYALVSLAQQAGLTLADGALSQMDQVVPMAQRQEAVELAAKLRSEADATRAQQLAALDLGAAAQPVLGPVAAGTTSPMGDDSPATAGADYTRPPAPRPLPMRPVVAASANAALPAAKPVQVAPAPALAPAVAPASSGPWRVQLGAFGQPANADALWNRLKSNRALVGKSRFNVRTGTVIKLQAGGFASEAAARAACQELSAAGQTCIAVRG